MKIIDISWPITNNIATYKDKNDVKISWIKTFDKDNVRESSICIGSHTGTHVDAPAHFLKEGKYLSDYSLNQLIGNCMVLDLTDLNEKITSQDLVKFDLSNIEILLFKTKNSFLFPDSLFKKEFIYLDASAAQYLTQFNLKAIGIDYLGIERDQKDHQTHKTLFKKNILIIEGLRLDGVEQGEYKLICLPLNIEQSEAIPARAILIKN